MGGFRGGANSISGVFYEEKEKKTGVFAPEKSSYLKHSTNYYIFRNNTLVLYTKLKYLL